MKKRVNKKPVTPETALAEQNLPENAVEKVKLDRRTFLKGIGVAAGASAAAPAVAMAMAASGNLDPLSYRTRASHGDEYNKTMPEVFYKVLEDRPDYYGTTRIVGPMKQFEDAREHGFSQLVNRMANKDWSGEWGKTMKEVFDEIQKINASRTEQQKVDAIWGTAIVMASDQWHVNLGPGRWEPLPISKNKLDLSPELMTLQLKKVCKWYGLEQVGICELTERMKPFFYKIGRTHGTMRGGAPGYHDPGREVPWPPKYKYCVVLGNFEDLQGTKALTGPLNNISVATECSDNDIYAYYVETVIRGLGYDAQGQHIAGVDDAMETPLAVMAGLGELGRSGLLVSPWGAHIRTSVVFTNMPLVPDKPIDFGLQEFCKVCKKCADNCPSGAISKEPEPTNVNGTLRWGFDAHKCSKYRFVYGCASCAAVCPYSKEDNIVHNVGRVIGRNKLGATMLKTLDDLFYGASPTPRNLRDFAPWRI
jgi:reductive dehalogenase